LTVMQEKFKISGMADGVVTIKLNLDRQRVQNVRLSIPMLEVDQPLAKISRLDMLPAGTYEGVIVSNLKDGEEVTQPVTIEVLPGRESCYEFKLPGSDTNISRREQRTPISVPVDYRTSEGFWVSTESINISPTGVCVVKVQAINDTDVVVRLFAPIPYSPLECPARVRWTRDENGHPQMGLELFLTNTMKETISGWLDKGSDS
jgi:hypothetical protein